MDYTVAVAFFFGSMSVLEGQPKEAPARIQAAYVPTLVRNWCVTVSTSMLSKFS